MLSGSSEFVQRDWDIAQRDAFEKHVISLIGETNGD